MKEEKGCLFGILEAIEKNYVAALFLAAVTFIAGSTIRDSYFKSQQHELEQERIRAGLELKVGDYNGNQTLDKFYEINGVKIPLEVDGKPIAEYFKEQ